VLKIKRSIIYHDNGNIEREYWHKEGNGSYWHREDGPAIITYHDTGELYDEEWWVDNKLHRIDGPAFIRYYLSGEKKHEEWWVDNKIHRIDGPACIYYNNDGTIWLETYHINGEELTKREWEEYLIKEAMKEALE